MALTKVQSEMAGVGQVLQVVQGTTTSGTETTSSSYVATNLKASITPRSASNKILVIATMPSYIVGNVGEQGMTHAIYRNGSAAFAPTEGYVGLYTADYGSGQRNMRATMAIQYLDSPASTSSIEYKIYIKKYIGASCGICVDGTPAFITLMEIAA